MSNVANKCCLTTLDNPYDPFDEFTLWFLYDTEKGHNTCGYLARIANIPDSFTQKEENEEIERAIDEIIAHDFIGKYKKVVRQTA